MGAGLLDSPSLPAPGPGGLSRARFHPLVSPLFGGELGTPRGELDRETEARMGLPRRGCRFVSPPPRGLGTRWASRRKEAAGWRGVRIPAGSQEEMGWTGRGGGGGPVPGGTPHALPQPRQEPGRAMGTLQDTVSNPGERGTRGSRGICGVGLGVHSVLGLLGRCLSKGVGVPPSLCPLAPLAVGASRSRLRIPFCGQTSGGCAGKEGAPSAPPAGPSSESPTLLAPAAHFGEMEAASQYVGGKTLGPSCSRAFEHTQIWGGVA